MSGVAICEAVPVESADRENARGLLGRVVLIRHAETAWTVSGQYTSRTDVPLTDSGRHAARLLAVPVAGATFARVVTSPLGRARETCALAGLNARAEVDEDLAEWDYGGYEGLTPREIAARAPGWMLFCDGCPGGESPRQVAARADRVIARLRAMNGDVALVGHGDVFRVLAARWLGLPAVAGALFRLDPASVSILSHHRGMPVIERWNAPFGF
jgi:probable phosphoglycerate mutase